MENIVYDEIGLLHLIASLLALVFGTFVLLTKKGTKTHKKMGYIYVVSMVIMLVTAFMIYRLFGGWGIFHYAALLSSLTLIGGMIPMFIGKPQKKLLETHLSLMYWSVIGLYAAFASEVLTRLPGYRFFEMVGVATGIIMFIGGSIFYFKLKSWKRKWKIN